jgi:hypothetical protein
MHGNRPLRSNTPAGPALVFVSALLSLGCAEQCPTGTRAIHDRCIGEPLPLAAYLKAPSRETGAWFGFAIALDSAGVVVAAPFEDEYGADQQIPSAGATYVFESADNYSNPRRLVAPNPGLLDGEVPYDIVRQEFRGEGNNKDPWGGLDIALSDELVVVGATGESSATGGPNVDPETDTNNDASYAGAVYVYDRRSESLGSPRQYLKAPKPRSYDLYGYALALSESWLAVGAPGNDEEARDSGSVYLYKLENGVFVPHGTGIKAPAPSEESFFGRAIAMEGDVMVIGAPVTTGPGGERGAGRVFVYRRNGDDWRYVADLFSPFPSYRAFFGFSVSLSGNRFAVGSTGAPSCGPHEPLGSWWRGAAYVVTLNGDALSVGPCLAARTGGPAPGFGGSVALLGDQLAISAPWDTNGPPGEPAGSSPFTGAAYLYEYSPEHGFLETKYIKAPNAHVNDSFGFPVALMPGVIAIGSVNQSGDQESIEARPEDDPASSSGAAYLFRLPER